jgi:hypothetical protein
MLGRAHLCHVGQTPALSYYPDESLLLLSRDVVLHAVGVCEPLVQRQDLGWGNPDGFTRVIQACLLHTLEGFRVFNEMRYVYAFETQGDERTAGFMGHRMRMHNGTFATANTTFSEQELDGVVPSFCDDFLARKECVRRDMEILFEHNADANHTVAMPVRPLLTTAEAMRKFAVLAKPRGQPLQPRCREAYMRGKASCACSADRADGHAGSYNASILALAV